MPVSLSAQIERDPVEYPHWIYVQTCFLTAFSLGGHAALRADLGQSPSGNSSLFTWDVSRRGTIVELAVWEIGPTPLSWPLETTYDAPFRGAMEQVWKVARQIGGLRLPRPRRGVPSKYQLLSMDLKSQHTGQRSRSDDRSHRTAAATLGDRGAIGRLRVLDRVVGRSRVPFSGNRERLARGAGGGNERPCSPARCRRNPPPRWPSHGSPASKDSSILARSPFNSLDSAPIPPHPFEASGTP